ncbi:MAG TPA: hypothetical protein VNT81_08350 [Vicinamibacterales bacterium]|nr:hypothetical protein [Vicinamibacterales bacterium]
MSRVPARKRGRPQKFGRAAQLISLTLPRDVINWLETVDDDLAWAIVKIFERSTRNRTKQVEIAQLVRFPGDAALILVRPELFRNLPGVSLIQLTDGRAFLALEHGKGVADLELLVVDRLESKSLPADERTALNQLRQLLRAWRQDGVQFESRSIIVARGSKGLPPKGP